MSSNDDELRQLLEAYLPVAYRFAHCLLGDHHAAEDVAQDAMLRAWKDRKTLRKFSTGRAWLLRITSNLCLDRLRRSRHPVSRAQVVSDEMLIGHDSPQSKLIQDEQIRLIQDAIRKLPTRYRAVLYLRSIEGMTHQEIAGVLNLTVGNTKVCLSRARSKLRDQLRESGVVEGDVI